MRIPRLFLRVIDPAQMYFDRVSRIPQEPAYRGGAVFGPCVPGGSRQATDDELAEFDAESRRHREESARRRQEVAAG